MSEQNQQESNDVDEEETVKIGIGICPLCKGKVVENRVAFSCSNWKENGCKFGIWKSISGREIDEETATTLLVNGITPDLTGFTSRKGREFNAVLKLKDGKVIFVFQEEEA
ncbi:MAG: topoisomerase C-terminal repeat-containing protein [Candidatus Margulisbacteria bacterium]|nr:topoisomerase C-terminal repeat-containing protein [Candidatus Margulisiibacteriota bacterium]